MVLDPQWDRLGSNNRAAPASDGPGLVIPCTTSCSTHPWANRRARTSRNAWPTPGQSDRYSGRAGVAVRVRVSTRPCPFDRVVTVFGWSVGGKADDSWNRAAMSGCRVGGLSSTVNRSSRPASNTVSGGRPTEPVADAA
ncbi:MAG TPA: hypothetical protein VH092_08895 [Urbifossiella sp.]|nr:hypothetical protein [Urbifossiella sp.]